MPSYYKMHLDETLKKGIYGGQVQDLGFLGDVGTTQSALFDVGDVVVLPDGREFRYCKSAGSNVIKPQLGCNFTETGLISYTSVTTAAAKGSREITIPAATHSALTKDQLKGGFIIIFDNTYDADVTYCIAGNDASDANVAFDVQLEMPLVLPLTTSDAVEVYSNPWGSMDQGNTIVLPRAGASVSYVSAAENYFWVQTKGVKHISPQSGVGADNGGLVGYWRHDGSMQKGETALAVTVATNDTIQPAGTVIAGSQAGNGPLVNLMGY